MESSLEATQVRVGTSGRRGAASKIVEKMHT